MKPIPLPVTPYKKINDCKIDRGVLKLTAKDFRTAIVREGTTTLAFFNCRINKLRITSIEDLNFGAVSIGFFNCYIGDLTVDVFTPKIISIGFYGSFISGRIQNENLLGIELNNCLSLNTTFLIDVSRVQISYTKENFHPNHWIDLCENLNLSIPEIPTSRYHITNTTHCYISSNFGDQADERFQPAINLHFDKENNKITKISGISLFSFGITGKPNGEISVENTKINSLYIYDFYPQATVSFHNIQPISVDKSDVKIGIHKSLLDKVEFDNVSFDQYKIISFYRTKFSKAIFTSCDFPTDYKTFSKFVPIPNVHYPDERPRNYQKAQYEIFLQLKKAMDDTGNYYESQKLQSMAHEALRNIKTLSFADKTILCINHLSNEHGLSISRPIKGFLYFSIPLYIFYLWSLDRIFNSNEIDWNLIGYYFSFVDITHRVNFLVEKTDLTGFALFWDYLGKLVVGFFIYQFIASFRKYGKSK